jgi:hypothetical protein
MVKYLSFHNFSFALRYFLILMARPQCDKLFVIVAKEVTTQAMNQYVLPWVNLKHTNGLSQSFNFDENLVVP